MTETATNIAKFQIVGAKPAWNEELRAWLERFIEQYPHKTTAILSRSDHIGASKTALDNYLSGTYFLAKEQGGMGVKPDGSSKIEGLIQAFREREEGTAGDAAQIFVATVAWHQLVSACDTAIKERAIVVVYARPGTGKSFCLREYAKQRTTTRPVSILCSRNITPRYFVQRLAQELRLDDRPSTPRLEDNLAHRLKTNPRPIFIDQANYLTEKSLGTLCYLWEVARTPIALVGTKDLHELFITSRLTQDVRAQLSSRVQMHYELKGLNEQEIKTIVRRSLGDLVSDADITLILRVSGGVFRHVAMSLPRIATLARRNRQQLASGAVTMEQVIREAFTRLFVDL